MTRKLRTPMEAVWLGDSHQCTYSEHITRTLPYLHNLVQRSSRQATEPSHLSNQQRSEKARADRADAQERVANDKLAALAQELQEATRKHSAAADECRQLEEQLRERGAKHRHLEHERAGLQQQCLALEKQHRDLQTRCRTLQEENKRLEQLVDDVRRRSVIEHLSTCSANDGAGYASNWEEFLNALLASAAAHPRGHPASRLAALHADRAVIVARLGRHVYGALSSRIHTFASGPDNDGNNKNSSSGSGFSGSKPPVLTAGGSAVQRRYEDVLFEFLDWVYAELALGRDGEWDYEEMRRRLRVRWNPCKEGKTPST